MFKKKVVKLLSILLDKFNYTKPQFKGACAVNVNGIDMFHEACYCISSQSPVCHTMCDSDDHCKGYVNAGRGCHIATNSTCQPRCSKHHVGNVGDLIINSTLNDFANSYEGCFIKKSGILKHWS